MLVFVFLITNELLFPVQQGNNDITIANMFTGFTFLLKFPYVSYADYSILEHAVPNISDVVLDNFINSVFNYGSGRTLKGNSNGIYRPLKITGTKCDNNELGAIYVPIE